MKPLFLLSGVLVAGLFLAGCAGYEAGKAAFDKGDYPAAFREFEPLANRGHREVQHYLGLMYVKGRGDYAQAAHWFRRAAEERHPDAQYSLSALYDEGRGVPQDHAQATHWFRKATEQGQADAQYNLGIMYEQGNGLARNDTEAASWYRKAAEQGLAQAPELVTDRPDQTESSAVVPRGTVQLETGWLFSREDGGGLRVDTHEIPGTLVRVGLLERLELRFGWSGFTSVERRAAASETKTDGAGDAEVGAKLYLRSERGPAPETALLVGLSLPVGDEEISSERADPSFRFSMSHSLSQRLALGYNLGMAWGSAPDQRGERDTLSDYLYTATLGIGINSRVGSFVELFGEIPASADGGPRNSFDGGFTFLVRDNLQLDVFGGVGLSDAANDWFFGFGICARFPE